MIELPDQYGAEILRVEVGSTLHGTGLGVAHEDHDEMGIAVEWPDTLRLGLQGIEFLSTGKLTLPMAGYEADLLRSVRRGEWSFELVIEWAERLEAQVKALLDGGSPLPDEPAAYEVGRWVVAAHFLAWDAHARCLVT